MTPRNFKQGLSTETLTVPETAAYLNLSVETVRRLLLDGQIYGFRLGRGKVHILRDSVTKYLDEQQTLPVYDYAAQRRMQQLRRQRLKQLTREAAARARAAAHGPSRSTAAQRSTAAHRSPAAQRSAARPASARTPRAGRAS